MKKVAIITYSQEDSIRFESQLVSLFYGLISVESYFTEGRPLNDFPTAELYLIGNSVFESENQFMKCLPSGAEYVIAKTSFTKKAIARIKKLPAGTQALFVSCNEVLCSEAITRLHSLGISHIDLIPYYPGIHYINNTECAITPGESRYMPEVIQYMIDIGGRYLDANTIMELMIKLNFENLISQAKLKEYFDLLADNTYTFNKLFERSVQSENRLDILLDLLDEGIVGVDDHGMIFACNKRAESILGISKSLVINRNAKVLDFIPFVESRSNSRPSSPMLIKRNGSWINVNINPIIYNGMNMGMFASIQRFKDLENRQNILRSQMHEEMQQAKYTFSDIICHSAPMQQACSIAQKMAKTSSSILITGESGTGKELFAHAIHNASTRSSAPFIAINCAALPDTLLESELFGYEEGAFTGARKGGKTGLFENAHSGSIFLDEVEGMSSALQVKLLRALQEKEVMHVGGSGVIHVDVRVIAASNEHLESLVERGIFRSDLYYRLNTLPLYIPPLRERKDDLRYLIPHFQTNIDAHFSIGEDVWQVLMNYPWKGNVRELQNCIEYLSFIDKDEISVSDLPPSFRNYVKYAKPEKSASSADPLHVTPPNITIESYLFVLDCLNKASCTGHGLGRTSFLSMAHEHGLSFTQSEMRFMLSELERLKLIQINIGRAGSRITELGAVALSQDLMGY